MYVCISLNLDHGISVAVASGTAVIPILTIRSFRACCFIAFIQISDDTCSKNWVAPCANVPAVCISFLFISHKVSYPVAPMLDGDMGSRSMAGDGNVTVKNSLELKVGLRHGR